MGMVAIPRSGAEISKKNKGDKIDGQTQRDNRSITVATLLCYDVVVGNMTVGGLLWLFHFQAARQKKNATVNVNEIDRLN